MSTTIELEVDVFVAAESRARREHCPINTVINELLREALVTPKPLTLAIAGGGTHFTMDSITGLPVVQGDRAFDSEDVARIEWELG